ncbi:MAG TPA: DNA repair exonuclease [Blastocatellia bacterium]|nr:DNA repair exonuclease [Blastocatellia bacterium]
MARFLHVADIHLGIKRYNLPDRTTDFFRAWQDVIERYAIEQRVDFVLIAGDLFDQRKVEPQAANHAMLMFRRLEAKNIPVLAIEGNHDQREAVSKFSWLRSFSQWRYLKLLEPEWTEDGNLEMRPWNEEQARGSYIDIADVRIFGSTWYGTTVGETIPRLASALAANRRPGAANILMLHSDVEGQLGRPIQSPLGLAKLSELKTSVDYLALGHTHKRFEIGGWAFNPGSLEACNVDEAFTTRGAYLVEIGAGQVKADFLEAGRDFCQRPFKRIEVELAGDQEPESARSSIDQAVEDACCGISELPEDKKPIIEVILRGQLGFRNSELKLEKLKEAALKRFQPLGLIVTNKTVPRQLAVAVDLAHDASSVDRELRVIHDLARMDPRLAPRAAEVAALVLEMKRLALEKEPPEKIFRLLEDRLFCEVANLPAAPIPQQPLLFAEVSD